MSSIVVRGKSSRATFNVYRNLVNIGHEVLKICSRTNTDRQTIICSPAGRRKYFVKMLGKIRFLRYARGQTHRHVDRNASHPLEEED